MKTSATARKSEIALRVIRRRGKRGLSTHLSLLHEEIERAGIPTKPTDNFFVWNLRTKGLVKVVAPATYFPS
jgi:hypothetical protein